MTAVHSRSGSMALMKPRMATHAYGTLSSRTTVPTTHVQSAKSIHTEKTATGPAQRKPTSIEVIVAIGEYLISHLAQPISAYLEVESYVRLSSGHNGLQVCCSHLRLLCVVTLSAQVDNPHLCPCVWSRRVRMPVTCTRILVCGHVAAAGWQFAFTSLTCYHAEQAGWRSEFPFFARGYAE